MFSSKFLFVAACLIRVLAMITQVAKVVCSLTMILNLFAVTARAALPLPWRDSPVGACYPAIGDYLTQEFGVEYKNDENIKVIQLPNIGWRKKNVDYVWAVDMTPTQNYSRVLFRVSDNGRACAVLLALASTAVSLHRTVKGELPKTVITNEAVPIGPATRVVYVLNSKTGNYYPKSCYRVWLTRDKVRRFDCGRAFGQR